MIGLLAGAGCWSAPFIQRFTAPYGNLAAQLRSTGDSGNRPRTRLTFELKALASAVQPPALWWQSPTQGTFVFGQISGGSAGFTVAMLTLGAVTGSAAAGRRGSHRG